MTNEELEKAKQIANLANIKQESAVLIGSELTNTMAFEAHFNPQFCLSLIEEIRRLDEALAIEKAFFKTASDGLSEMNEKLDRAIEVIKYYANPPTVLIGYEDCYSLPRCDGTNDYIPGKRARAFLKSIEKGGSE